MNMGQSSGISPIRAIQQPQPLQLKTGQLFHGTVQKLFPEQTAEVIVGGQRLIAKLEVPLKAGDSHYFVVTATSPEVKLKITSGPVSQHPTEGKQMGMLAQSLGLLPSTEMTEILAHIVSKQLSMSKEQMILAENWLKALPLDQHSNALLALGKMATLKMPFSEPVFRSMVAGIEKNGLLPLLEQLSEILNSEQALPKENRQLVRNALVNVLEPFRSTVSTTLLANAANPLQEGKSGESIAPLLKQSGIIPVSVTSGDWAWEALVKSDKLPADTLGYLLKQMLSPHRLTSHNESFNKLIDELQLSGTEQLKVGLDGEKSITPVVLKELQQKLLQSFVTNGPIQGDQIRSQLLSLIGLDATDEAVQRKLEGLIDLFRNSRDPNVKQLLQSTEEMIESTVDNRLMESAVKQVIRGLGINYEHALSRKTLDRDIGESLKPQLVSIINHPNASYMLKEAAEHVVNRLNGQQLLSTDSGQQQNIIMQIPLQFFGKKIDANVNLSGKMKEDGKIDADYVRVLFYLQLSSLNETVVDMSVQNRVVSIQLYNEDESLAYMAEPFREALKDGLATLNYRLSGLSIKPFSSVNEQKNTLVSTPLKGVDLRI